MGPVGEALNDDISTNTSERINEALQNVETPVQVPPRLELNNDERAELENFRTMFGRLHLGPSTFESSPADVSNTNFGSV